MPKNYNLEDLKQLFYGGYTTAEEDFYEAALTAGIVAQDLLDVVGDTGLEIHEGILAGAGAPASDLGTTGDFYLDTSTYDFYGPKPSADAWAGSVSLVGTAGNDGAPGSAGADGVNGNTILNGTSVPDSGDGVDGDFYLKTDTADLYGPKSGGSWGSATSLIGPAGSDGSPGPGPGDLSVYTTDDLDEGATNLYWSSTLAASYTAADTALDGRLDDLEGEKVHIAGWVIPGNAFAVDVPYLLTYRGPALTINLAEATVNTAPTGAALVFDIKKGTTTSRTAITTTGNRVSIAAAGHSDTTTTFSTTTCADGDVFSLTIVSVGTTVPGADIAFDLYGVRS
jgi:hypothetical protein